MITDLLYYRYTDLHWTASAHNTNKVVNHICQFWDLRASVVSWYHHREAQNHSPEHSRSPFLAGGMIFPPPFGLLDPCQSSSNNWKLISSVFTWLHLKKKTTFTLFALTSHCLARICSQQCLYICFASTSCVGLPLYNVSLIVFLNCKWLWIKVPAKWIHVADGFT